MYKVALLFTLLCAFSQQAPAKYNYAEVLHKSFLFYHAQRSGNLTNHRRLAWRTDSCFNCKGLNGEDLSGGYYEAGKSTSISSYLISISSKHNEMGTSAHFYYLPIGLECDRIQRCNQISQ